MYFLDLTPTGLPKYIGNLLSIGVFMITFAVLAMLLYYDVPVIFRSFCERFSKK